MPEKIKLEKINEKEFQIGENKLHIPEPDILFIESIGDQTDETADIYYDFYTKLLTTTSGKMNVIIDINKSKKSSTKARRTWKILSELDKTNKVAMFGLHPVAKVLAAFVISFTNKNDVKFFNTKEEAFAWVKD